MYHYAEELGCTKFHYFHNRRLGFRQVPLRLVNVYFHYRNVYNYFHYNPCTTNSFDERVPPRMHASKV